MPLKDLSSTANDSSAEELERLIKIERDKVKKKGGKDKEGEEEGEEAKEAHKSQETEGKKMLDDGQQPPKRTFAGHRSRNSTTTSEFESESRSFKTKGGKRVRENEHDKGRDEQRALKERGQVQPEKKRRRLSVVASSARQQSRFKELESRRRQRRTSRLRQDRRLVRSLDASERRGKRGKGRGGKEKGKHERVCVLCYITETFYRPSLRVINTPRGFFVFQRLV
ncbi:hypothetical protein JOM56_004605 [Amanita muscaria]